MVSCGRCGLVRSDPVLDEANLTHLYAKSTFEYEAETANLRATYGRYLARLRKIGGRQESLLEVGCGDGFFLEQALQQGYTTVRGVEPSEAAIAGASPRVRDQIVCDVMRPGLFPAGNSTRSASSRSSTTFPILGQSWRRAEKPCAPAE